MADTRAQHQAEQWVVQQGLASLFPGVSFAKRKVKLTWGGEFEFDAVSPDGKIVGAVSTSAARTASGKGAAAKYQKLKTDALYLLHAHEVERRVIVFTELAMLQYFEKQRELGRFPPEIELRYIALPPDMHTLVSEARQVASRETSPAGTKTNGL
jgi:hypothetical protein